MALEVKQLRPIAVAVAAAVAVAVAGVEKESKPRRVTSLVQGLSFRIRANFEFVLAALVGGGVVALFVALFHALSVAFLRYKRICAQRDWKRHVDLGVVQACILSTEHLQDIGRIEKRTLFVKPITEVFRNEYILQRVLATAEEAAASGNTMLVPQLSAEDKWHVLNTCTNHLSSCFAPYHVFFNEARRCDSYYKSAWYCFTLTCAQTSASGRWFITPLKPVGTEDCGMLRIRIVLMNEQELREIAAGAVEPPSFGFFNGRHESRWNVCLRFSELFMRQVRNVTGHDDIHADWGPNLCGTGTLHKKRQAASSGSGRNISAMAEPSPAPAHPDDNSLLRLHIPFPCSQAPTNATEEERREENVSKDVVLFE